MIAYNSKDIEELKEILQQVGPKNIWRPVYTPDNQILSDGIGEECEGLTGDLHGLNFQDKTVVDLGCNLGFYSFLIKKAGAASVLGIDIDNRIIRGCNIIMGMFQVKGVSFRTQDISTLNGDQTFEIGMLIDFIGKDIVHSGMFPRFLDTLELVSEKEMILSVRPIYRIRKHLQDDTQGIIDKYSTKYVRNGCFYSLEFATDRFQDNWDITIVSPRNDPEGVIKETLLLTRKGL